MSQDNCHFLKSMLDTMINPICYKDRNGIYLGINRAFATQIAGLPEEEIVGYSLPEVAGKVIERFPERAFVNGTFLLDHVIEWDKDDMGLLKYGGKSTHEYEGICADGIKRSFLVSKSIFNNESGEIAGLITALQDITELNETKKKLEKDEERYHIITEQTGQIVFEYDIKNKTISWSGATRELMGCDLKDFESTDIDVWLNRIHPEERDIIWQAFEDFIKSEENFSLEYKLKKTDESYICVEENAVCLKDENGNTNRVLGVIKDITERKLAQERLEISEENYRSFIQNFKGIAFQLDEDFLPEFMHGEVEEITGYTEEDFLSGRVLWMRIIHPEDMPSVLKDIESIRNAPYNLSRDLDFRIINKNGRIKWVRQSYQKVQRKHGKSDKYQGTIHDLTRIKETEKFIENIEIARRRETHHRIKNNLQVISSLLDLQAEKFSNRTCIKDSEVLDAFRESRDRVMSIALIHKELHEDGMLERLNISLYLQRLAENLFQTYRIGYADISLDLKLEEDIFFDMDIAVPLGMIVNELVSNSLKYAFRDKDKGRIKIKLFKEETYNEQISSEEEPAKKVFKYTLKVSDDGSGIPKTVDLRNPNTLGLQLVHVLVDQLEGKIRLRRDRGTAFTINFNIVENNNNNGK